MKRIGAAALIALMLILTTTVPSDARGRGGGGGHGYRGHHGHRHHHHGGWGYWGAGAFIGGLALGTAFAWPYYAYGYPTYPVYSPPAPTPVVYEQGPAPQPIQREVVYSHGKYVLHGDGVSQAWQWVWIPASGPPAPPPAPR